MAEYTPQQLGITAPAGGFQTGGWYGGRQFWGGTLSEPGVIHPLSNQQGAGQLVSPEVNLQSDKVQGNQPGDIERYLESQRQKQVQITPTPTQTPIQTPIQTTSVKPVSSAVPPSISGTGLAGALGSSQAPINLPNQYKSLYETSGIGEKESRIRDLESKYLEARGKISDNPFLSASQVDQRLKRLDAKYQQETSPLRNEIATAKADIETQLNLQTKQFDINSQASKDALSYFNTLLESGALDTASGDDIAQIVYATGVPSSLIQSAINARTQKDRELFIDTFTSDSGEVTAVAIDKNTGEIVSKNSLGLVGNQQTSGSGSLTPTQQRSLVASARQALTDVDLNQDEGVSAQEYIEAVQTVMTSTGVDQATADNLVEQALDDLGYWRWQW